MRVALFSDIHANLVSLEAVLEDIDREPVDQIVCLGDVAVLGPQPHEVMARLAALDCACVMGNHDDDLLHPDEADEVAPEIVGLTAWTVDQLSEADLDFVRSFRPRIEIPLGADAALLCYHGSPRSSADRILSTTPAGELEEMLAGYTATAMVGGHNHVQMLRQYGGTLIVDVGSVGAPLEEMPFVGTPRFLSCAEYAIVHWEDGVSRRYPNVEYQVADATRWEFPVERFDCVASIAAMHHLPLEEMLLKIKGALRVGGVLVMLDLCESVGLGGLLIDAVAVPVSIALRLVKSGRMRTPREVREVWAEHGQRDIYPRLTTVRQVCARVLPGAKVRRHLLWRYSIVWRKGGRDGRTVDPHPRA